MRNLATIRTIKSIDSIPNADAIVLCTVDGWKVVTKKGEYKVGDQCVYVEIDSWVPNTLAPFLSKGREPREFNGVKGERLRTIKLRGTLSQGLILPLNVLTDAPQNTWGNPIDYLQSDVTELLGIQKWEAPIPTQLSGKVLGTFPAFIPKTDQERIQNIVEDFSSYKRFYWEVTEKLDGSSMTVYVNFDKSGVCSRNYDLNADINNSFWSVAISKQIVEKIKSTGRNLAFQGELVGPGVQKNKYKLNALDFYLFDIYDIDMERYLYPDERYKIAVDLNINHVPIISNMEEISCDVDELLQNAEGKSRLCSTTEKEGLVYKCARGRLSFKVISNKFLLKDE
jgi:RNA ligase (TIGR02306 family)